MPKGVSGNPGGRPKHKPISDGLRFLLGRYVSEMSDQTKNSEEKGEQLLQLRKKPGQRMTVRDALCMAIMNDAIRGKGDARQIVIERTEGKVPVPITGSDDPDDVPIKIEQQTSLKELARVCAFMLVEGAPDEKGKKG